MCSTGKRTYAAMDAITGQYRRAMKRRNLRSSSIDARMGCVYAWLDRVGDRWPEATGDDLEDWLDSLRGRDGVSELSARTRYCKISHLHQFYRWAIRQRLVPADPTVMIERPRLPRGLPRPARMGDVTMGIELADPTMAVMLSLMADAGLRCCEVAWLEWCDVDVAGGTIHVSGKGGHERVVGIPARLAELLEGVLEYHGAVIGRKISPCRVSQIVCGYLRSIGAGVTAHQLRHLYATRMLAATDDITAVQQALGHASISSTQIYAQVNPARALSAARGLVA